MRGNAPALRSRPARVRGSDGLRPRAVRSRRPVPGARDRQSVRCDDGRTRRLACLRRPLSFIGHRGASMSIDPITIEVVTSCIREIAATMEHALYHSGYSPVLRESKDGTAGLTDAEGRVVIVSGGLQYHSLPYQHAVRSVLARYPKESLVPGESFVVNDPYLGGNPHAPDMVAVTPGFVDGVLLGFGVR